MIEEIQNRLSFGLLSVVLITTAVFVSCDQPVMESGDCLQSRDTVKKLYSIHLDGGANPTGPKLEKLRRFVTVDLYKLLSSADGSGEDYLTQQTDFPKAFRAGACRDTDAGPELDVLLLWRNEESNTERTIVVNTIKQEKWVVNAVRKLEENGR
jgi:hypothetical protein